MAVNPNSSAARYSRFVFSVLPGCALVIVWLLYTVFVDSFLAGGWGLFIAICAGVSLVFGVLLMYRVGVDWLNLRVIRQQIATGKDELKDATVVAFSGMTRCEGSPLVSPITNKPCVAYTYSIAVTVHSSGSITSTRRSRRRVLAQGFHMQSARIEGDTQTLQICSFPGFETDMQESDAGDKWGEQAKALLNRLIGTARQADDAERISHLLAVQNSVIDGVHQDYCQVTESPPGTAFDIEEEVLPADEPATVIGTFDAKRGALVARNSRLGPNLMVYGGDLNHVLDRIGKEITWYARFIRAFLGFAVVVFVIVLLPTGWASTLPLIGPLIIP